MSKEIFGEYVFVNGYVIVILDFYKNHQHADFGHLLRPIGAGISLGYTTNNVNERVLRQKSYCMCMDSYQISYFCDTVVCSKRFRNSLGGFLINFFSGANLRPSTDVKYSLVVLATFHDRDWIDHRW